MNNVKQINGQKVTGVPVRNEACRSSPDGMIFDSKRNLYLADLEKHKVVYYTPVGEMKTLCKGEQVGWGDTFSIYDGYLYITNSRLHETQCNISEKVFIIEKIKLDF